MVSIYISLKELVQNLFKLAAFTEQVNCVSVTPGLQWVHSLSSLGSQVCLCLPFSMARLWLLGSYLIKAFIP